MARDETRVADVAQYVLFRLDEEEYGLPIGLVSSVIRYEQPTPVPHAPPAVDGVISLRGRIIPIVNLKRRLLDRPLEPTAVTRIVVVEGAGGSVGLVVDAASEVVAISSEEIEDAPETALTAETADILSGVANHGGRLIILLDLDRALPRSEYGSLTDQEGGDDG